MRKIIESQMTFGEVDISKGKIPLDLVLSAACCSKKTSHVHIPFDEVKENRNKRVGQEPYQWLFPLKAYWLQYRDR
jgi:hypothetical protein